ncbi:hypothetical protein PHLCEN_2v1332 [Hermanssonia centrifuga]|uniref:Gfd2/YDR514C-like C-terminal domain-containing protein n=1 Tax=Hermanssonia centrifuga TaxID=98765 RepID=A0A2R6S3D4_9APHY|nr:hypothetical protein PHLCEN_2v1332 [Hermanssonia centrifuga]
MSDFNLVDPRGWEYDLQSRRFGETLPVVDNILRVSPFETTQRHLRTISDYGLYKKLHTTLPAAVLAALKVRVRDGEPKAIRELWQMRDKTFLAIDFEWSERNTASCLEWGYAAARCNHLEALVPLSADPSAVLQYIHLVGLEFGLLIRKQTTVCCEPFMTLCSALGSTYGSSQFGDSQLLSKVKLPQVIQAVISTMSSPDSETVANSLVLVAHGLNGDLRRLEEMKIKIPHNVLVIDTATYERQLFSAGLRGEMQDPSGNPRAQDSTLSLTNFLQSLGVDVQVTMHNAGNDAFMCMLALQMLLDPETTKVPSMRGRNVQQAVIRNASRSPGGMPAMGLTPPVPKYGMMPMGSPVPYPQLSPDLYFDQDGGSSRRASPNQPSAGGQRPRKSSGQSPADRRGSMSRRPSGGMVTLVDDTAERMSNLRMG